MDRRGILLVRDRNLRRGRVRWCRERRAACLWFLVSFAVFAATVAMLLDFVVPRPPLMPTGDTTEITLSSLGVVERIQRSFGVDEDLLQVVFDERVEKYAVTFSDLPVPPKLDVGLAGCWATKNSWQGSTLTMVFTLLNPNCRAIYLDLPVSESSFFEVRSFRTKSYMIVQSQTDEPLTPVKDLLGASVGQVSRRGDYRVDQAGTSADVCRAANYGVVNPVLDCGSYWYRIDGGGSPRWGAPLSQFYADSVPLGYSDFREARLFLGGLLIAVSAGAFGQSMSARRRQGRVEQKDHSR